MANVYNTIYEGGFCDEYDREVFVEFKKRMPDSDPVPEPIDIIFAGKEPVVISYPTVDSYKLEPINGCECSVSLKALGDFELADMYAADEKEWLIVVSGEMDFIGFIIPDACIEPYASKPYDVTVSATDALATLEDIPFLNTDGSKIRGFISDIDALVTCFGYTGLSLDMVFGVNTFEDSMDTSDCPVAQIWHDSARYFDEDENPFSCYEVIKGIMSRWSLRLRQNIGRWEMMNPLEQSSGAVRSWVFSSSGSYIGEETIGNSMTVGEQYRPVIPTSANVSLGKALAASTAYYQIGRPTNSQFNGDFNDATVPNLPAGWSATSDAEGGSGVEYDPNTGQPTADKYLIIQTSESDDAFILSDNGVLVEIGQTATVSFNMRIPDVGTNSNTFVLDLLVMHVGLGGTLYLDDKGWSAFGQTYQIEFKGYKELQGVKTVTFEIPAMFRSFDVFIGFKAIRTKSAGNEYTTHINNLKVSVTATSERKKAPVGMINRQTLKSAQSYRKEPVTLLHGDDPNTQVTSRLSVGQASPVIPTNSWTRSGYGESQTLLYLVANTELTLHQSTYRVFEADFVGEGNVNPNTLLSIDLLDGVFIFLSGSYDLKTGVRRLRFAQTFPVLDENDFYEVVKDDFGQEADGEGLVGSPVSPTPGNGGAIGGGNGEGEGGSGGGGGTVTEVTSANTDIAVVDGTTTPELTLNTGYSFGQIVSRTTGGGVSFDSNANARIYSGADEEIYYSANEPINGKNGFHSWLIRSIEAMRLNTEGELLISVMQVGLTPPVTAGTTKMVITDANGKLSFTDIPSGGFITSLTTTGENGPADVSGGVLNIPEYKSDVEISAIDSETITVSNSNGAGFVLPKATTSLAGLMTGTDKAKLDGLSGDVDLSLGTATGTTQPINNSAGDGVVLPSATTSAAGLLSATDKVKLDGITGTASSGTYTPTLTAGTNVSGLALSYAHYIRVDNEVTVTGRFRVDFTSGLTFSQLYISLPISSDLTSDITLQGQGVGISSPGFVSVVCIISADAVGDRAFLSVISHALDITGQDFKYSFTYTII